MLVVLSFVAVAGYITIMGYFLLLSEPFCSYPGSCGHLIWTLQPTWVWLVGWYTYIIPLLFLVPVIRCNDGRKYKWFPAGVFASGFPTYIITKGYVHIAKCDPGEFGTMW